MRTNVIIRTLALALSAHLTTGALAAGAPVEVVMPKRITVTEQLQLTGTLTAERNARLSPRVDGLVDSLAVDAGDRVKAGQVLLQLDADLASHALRRAEADAAQARARLSEAKRLVDEARRLVGDKHLPQTELQRRESDLKLAEAASLASEAARREQAELVRRHELPAPFDGVVARRLTEVGEWVTRGTPVLELVATDRVRLDVYAPQEQFAAIDEDARVVVRPAGRSEDVLTGRIVARVPIASSDARNFLIRIVVEDPDSKLLPGASASASIAMRGSQAAVAAPRDALQRYPDGTHSVFVVVEQKDGAIVRERRVQIGRGGEQVEILDGLKPGERVVVRGNESLRDGQAVEIVASRTLDAT